MRLLSLWNVELGSPKSVFPSRDHLKWLQNKLSLIPKKSAVGFFFFFNYMHLPSYSRTHTCPSTRTQAGARTRAAGGTTLITTAPELSHLTALGLRVVHRSHRWASP